VIPVVALVVEIGGVEMVDHIAGLTPDVTIT
jgi:hypothetical protein